MDKKIWAIERRVGMLLYCLCFNGLSIKQSPAAATSGIARFMPNGYFHTSIEIDWVIVGWSFLVCVCVFHRTHSLGCVVSAHKRCVEGISWWRWARTQSWSQYTKSRSLQNIVCGRSKKYNRERDIIWQNSRKNADGLNPLAMAFIKFLWKTLTASVVLLSQ